MTSTYDLVDSPWIRVRTLEGQTTELGVRELLLQAHRIERLAGELPTQDFAVFRVLLAVLYRALDSTPAADPTEKWEELWEADALPAEEITRYLEQWRHRFDLFHPVQPFMQVADLRTAKGEWKTLDVLVPDCPGSGALYRRGDPDRPLNPGEAARWLVHCHAYDPSGIKSGAVGDDRVTGGKGYPIPVGWPGWIGGQTAVGGDLKETLLLNLVLDRPHDARDVPIWEEEPMTSTVRPPSTRGPFGQVGLLTWPEKRVRLREEAGLVTDVLVCNGDPIEYTAQLRNELMTSWRYSEPQSRKAKTVVYMPQAMSEGRALWRGLESLLPHASTDKLDSEYGPVDRTRPSGVLTWVDTLVGDRCLPRDFQIRLEVVGMSYGAQMAVIDSILRDSLTFAAALTDVDSPALRFAATSAVREAEEAVRALRSLANNLAVASGGETGPAGEKAAASAFDELDGMFRSWLLTLNPESSPDERLSAWRERVRSLVTGLGESLVEQVSPDAWRGREHNGRIVSIGIAEKWFRSALYKALPRPAESTPESTDRSSTTRTSTTVIDEEGRR